MHILAVPLLPMKGSIASVVFDHFHSLDVRIRDGLPATVLLILQGIDIRRQKLKLNRAAVWCDKARGERSDRNRVKIIGGNQARNKRWSVISQGEYRGYR